MIFFWRFLLAVLGCRQSNKNDLYEIIFVTNVMNTGTNSYIFVGRILPTTAILWHVAEGEHIGFDLSPNHISCFRIKLKFLQRI